MNKNNIIFFSIIIFIIILLFILINNVKENFTNVDRINNFKYYDENNELIDNMKEEYVEQIQANKYLEPDAVVLELGARYGSVSCIINNKLKNKKNQVSVEPDSKVWNALQNNMNLNNTNFNIVKGFISSKPMVLEGDGYGITFKDVNKSDIDNFTLEDIENKYNLKFDTLVADCEGCLERFFDENPKLYDELKLIIMEEDQPQKCNYDKIKNNLKKSKFKLLESDHNIVNRSVWKK